jgi:hypothetical protein
MTSCSGGGVATRCCWLPSTHHFLSVILHQPLVVIDPPATARRPPPAASNHPPLVIVGWHGGGNQKIGFSSDRKDGLKQSAKGSYLFITQRYVAPPPRGGGGGGGVTNFTFPLSDTSGGVGPESLEEATRRMGARSATNSGAHESVAKNWQLRR